MTTNLPVGRVGAIGGVPAVAIRSELTVRVMDSAGAQADASLALTVR